MAKGVSVRLEEETINQLNSIAKAADRDASYLMRKAIEQFVQQEGWIIRETESRLKKVKAGEAVFFSHDEVKDQFFPKRSKGHPHKRTI